MNLQPQPDEDARAELRRVMLDDTYSAARAEYARTILAILVKIEDWIAIDSWIGGGKVADTKRREKFGQAYTEFRAVATVVSMASELAEAAVTMAEKRRYYAVGAIIRQLIECEYLLALFNEDLDQARVWAKSTPDEVRESFTPAKMRKLLTGRFSNEEYWKHCATGGHPAPKGAQLLEKLDPRRRSWPYYAAELATDLGLHLHRTWAAVDALLSAHHARYVQVRTDQRQQAEEAWTRWRNADPLVAALTGFESKAPIADSAAERESPHTATA